MRIGALGMTVLPPAALVMLNDDPAVTSLAPLRYVRSVSAPLSPAHARRFHDDTIGHLPTEVIGKILKVGQFRHHDRDRATEAGGTCRLLA